MQDIEQLRSWLTVLRQVAAAYPTGTIENVVQNIEDRVAILEKYKNQTPDNS